MNVVPPLAITDARFTSSTVVETAPAAYAGGTTYAIGDTVSVAGAAGLLTVYSSLQDGNIGHSPASSSTWWSNIGDTYGVYAGGTTYALADRVIDATNHLIYESLAGSNTGNALTDTTKWLLIGPTNKWALFDLLRNSATVVPLSMGFSITPGVRIDSITLAGLVGNFAAVSVTVDAVEVYYHNENLNTRRVNGWYEYFFIPFSTKESFSLFDLPPYANGIISVGITATSGNVECAACVVGSFVYIGDIQYSAVSDVLNFSSVTRDFAGGTATMIQRRNVPKTIQELMVAKSLVNRVRDLRDSLNASPAVWAGIDDNDSDYFESILIIGFYKQFSINIAHPEHAVISLELEEI